MRIFFGCVVKKNNSRSSTPNHHHQHGHYISARAGGFERVLDRTHTDETLARSAPDTNETIFVLTTRNNTRDVCQVLRLFI